MNKADKDALRAYHKIREDNREKAFNDKSERLANYYDQKFNELFDKTMSSINEGDDLDTIKQKLEKGNKEWKELCARTRKTNKHVKLDVFSFEKQTEELFKQIKDHAAELGATNTD